MKAIAQNNLSIVSCQLDDASLVGSAFVVNAPAKLKHPVCVARFMWCARSTCGRWLG